MRELVFFLEESSAEAMLKGLLPRFLPTDIFVRYIVFEGKQDLEKQLVRRMKGYLTPNAKFIILRDKDSGDCKEIKQILVDKCHEAKRADVDVLVRIACHELESWYLADLRAVELGIGVSGVAQLQMKSRFRNPDNVQSPFRVLKKIVPEYQKIGGSRSIGEYLDVNNTRSRSFSIFMEGIRKLCGI